MTYIIVAALLLLCAISSLVVFLCRNKATDPDVKGVMTAAGPAAIVWAVILGLVSFGMSITVVDSRAVGIQTSFGKYRDTLSNGFQLTAPWSDTEQFTTRVQYLDLDGDQAVPVTFKGGGGGDISTTPRWRISEKKAGDLWKKYKTFGAVESKLVNSAAKDSVRVVAAKYTPNEARSGEFLRKVSAEVERDLAVTLADDGILIDSVSIKGIRLDERSQTSLDKIVEANNYIERAKAEQERAKIEAETAKIRQQTGALSDANITMKCLEILDKWNSANNGPLPAGFVCPGTDARGFVTTNK